MTHDSFLSRLDRRRFACLSAGAAGACLLPRTGFGAMAPQKAPNEPHFYLQIVFPGGMDPTYTWDARPLEFVAAQRHANYYTGERTRLVGVNGGSALTTALVSPLDPFKDRFSVLNGVVMMPLFDGHENNVGFLMTGDAFSGETIMPHLNAIGTPSPLDYVQMGGGTLLTTLTNTGNSVPLAPETAKAFGERLQKLPPFGDETPLKKFLRGRMTAAGKGKGRFSAGSRAMTDAFGRMPELAGALRDLKIEVPPPPTDPNQQQQQTDDAVGSAKLIGELFKRGVCRSALFVFNTDLNPGQNLDIHGVDDAKTMPDVIPKLLGQLADMLAHLAATPYDDHRSILDLTTFTVATEFGRTLKQSYPAFDKSGTDHNPLTNTVLIGGKGVKAGLVVGASDLQTLEETGSGAHLAQDKELNKMMGQPFDFATGMPSGLKPDFYREEDYLTYSSVANTVYTLFGAPKDRLRLLRRNAPAAPVISSLLV